MREVVLSKNNSPRLVWSEEALTCRHGEGNGRRANLIKQILLIRALSEGFKVTWLCTVNGSAPETNPIVSKQMKCHLLFILQLSLQLLHPYGQLSIFLLLLIGFVTLGFEFCNLNTGGKTTGSYNEKSPQKNVSTYSYFCSGVSLYVQLQQQPTLIMKLKWIYL